MSLTHEQLLAAARSVLATEGLSGLDMRSIARQAKVSLGSVQYILGTKQDILDALLARMNEEVADALQAMPATIDPRQVVGALAALLWRNVVSSPTVSLGENELFLHLARDESRRGLLDGSLGRYVDLVAQRISGVGVSPAQSQHTADALVAGIEGTFLLYLGHRNDERAFRAVATIAHALGNELAALVGAAT